MSVTLAQDGWFGEGDDFFYIDGEAVPSLQGTGSEDYFNDAWGFRPRTSVWFGQPRWQGWSGGRQRHLLPLARPGPGRLHEVAEGDDGAQGQPGRLRGRLVHRAPRLLQQRRLLVSDSASRSRSASLPPWPERRRSVAAPAPGPRLPSGEPLQRRYGRGADAGVLRRTAGAVRGRIDRAGCTPERCPLPSPEDGRYAVRLTAFTGAGIRSALTFELDGKAVSCRRVCRSGGARRPTCCSARTRLSAGDAHADVPRAGDLVRKGAPAGGGDAAPPEAAAGGRAAR